jgi:glycosyltransferase involved in cell wall biosynthesis
MCIIVPSYNNNANFRIEYNLNSIFQQNYSNYFVVIVNDASTDASDLLYRNYLDFWNFTPSSYVYISNPTRKMALENVYTANHEYCSADAIALTIDGDDELIGRNVLKIFNAAYQKLRAGVVYSNFYWYRQPVSIAQGFTKSYQEKEKKENAYRDLPQRFSQLRSFRVELFRQINPKISFIERGTGTFFSITADFAVFFPVMELACGRVHKIEGYHYLYNVETGNNDYTVDRDRQYETDKAIRQQMKYSCSAVFEQKMLAMP